MDPLSALLEEWREDAKVLAEHGREDQAERLRQRAQEVEAAVEQHKNEALPLDEASAVSGYAASSLRQMVRSGKIPDLRPPGSQGRIKIRRRHLPRKPPRAGGGDSSDAGEDPVARLAEKAGAPGR